MAVNIDYSIPLPAINTLDPNSVDTTDLLRLAVPVKIARRWIKFRQAGGSFVRKSDIGKLYGMPDSTLQRILPYFREPNLEVPRKEKSNRTKESEPQEATLVDVNTASSEELQTVRGIGPYYADRIIAHRQALGGFVKLEQVAETPGLRAEAYEGFRNQLTLNANELNRIYINRLEAWQLAKHPYISKQQAKVLVLNRQNRGPFRTKADLLATVVLDTATVERLLPYLDFSE
jgi:competence ComEA-like helix-hairpin-helix protein